jgi:serine/threonine-protein kinase RsbW
MIVERMAPSARPALTSGIIAHQRFSPDAVAVRAALIKWRQRMNEVGLPASLVSRAELALAELLNNIVEHGCVGVMGGWIVLNTRLAHDGLHLTILDNGNAPPDDLLGPGQAKFAHLGNLPLAAIPEGGFGWHLIRHFARDLALDDLLGINRLRLRVPLSEDGA